MNNSIAILERWNSDALFATGEVENKLISDLLHDIESLRAHLATCLLDHTIMVICQDRYFQTVGMMAAWQLGQTVSLPATIHTPSLDKIAHSGTTLVVHDSESRAGIHIASALAKNTKTSATLNPIHSNHTLVNLYTSGSTGTPQMHSKNASQLFNEADSHVRFFSLPAGQGLISTVPSHHVYGLLFSILLPIRAGMPMERSTPLHATTLASRVRATSPHTLISSPIHLKNASDILVSEELHSVQRVFSSGAALDNAVAHQFSNSFGIPITELLGSTETGGIAWRLRANGEPTLPPWQTLEGVTVSADETGDMLLTSPFLPSSEPMPKHCPDRITLLNSREFHHLGRSDDIVKIGSKRFSITGIEHSIRDMPGVEDAALLAVAAPGSRGYALWAAIVAPNLSISDLKKALMDRIEPIAFPRRIKIVKALPRQTNGKLPRLSLKQLFEHE
jgi:acyl-coenzyme A synthetase/AMP-(fatty) acid ligase